MNCDDCDLIVMLESKELTARDCKDLIQIIFDNLHTDAKVQNRVNKLLFESN